MRLHGLSQNSDQGLPVSSVQILQVCVVTLQALLLISDIFWLIHVPLTASQTPFFGRLGPHLKETNIVNPVYSWWLSRSFLSSLLLN